jgi:hypothetical protein
VPEDGGLGQIVVEDFGFELGTDLLGRWFPGGMVGRKLLGDHGAWIKVVGGEGEVYIW